MTEEVWILNVKYPPDFPSPGGWMHIGVYPTYVAAKRKLKKMELAGERIDSWDIRCCPIQHDEEEKVA